MNIAVAGCSRRAFCAGLGALPLAACGDFGSPAMPHDLAPPADEATANDLATKRDASTQADLIDVPDLVDRGGGGHCPGSVNFGGASVLAVGQAVVFMNVALCRDARGLYAMSAVCSHAGCVVGFAGGRFVCPCHGSVFGLDGSIKAGPAPLPMWHMALCINDKGEAVADPKTVVPVDARI